MQLLNERHCNAANLCSVEDVPNFLMMQFSTVVIYHVYDAEVYTEIGNTGSTTLL